MYTVFSFQRRSIELGTLQSMGLSFWGMVRYLTWELVFLVLIGLAGGTLLGMTISKLWIPYFRVGDPAFSDVLPMRVQFSWETVLGVYILFGLLLIATLGVSVALARRLDLFEDVKMLQVT